MSVRLKHYLLLLFMTSIAACNDGDPVDTSATMAVAPTVIPYAPGSPSFSLTVNPTTIMAGDVATLTVTALDSHGEPYSSAIKTILFNVSGGTSTGTIGLISPKGNGVYEASITGNISGTTSTIHAIVNGNTIASTGSLTVTTGPAKFVTVVDGNNLAAKVDTPLATNPKVKVTDKYGNAIIGANVDFEVTSGSSFVHDNSSTTYTVTTDANGFSEVPWIMGPTTGATTISATTVVSGGSATNTFSAMVYDKPSIPTLFITGVQGKVDLAWTLTSTGGGSIVYNLYRSNFLAGPFSQITSNSTSPSFSDVDATSGVFYYKVIANNGYIASDESAIVTNKITLTNAWYPNSTTAAQFTSSSPNLTFTANACEIIPVVQSDNNASGFSSGSHYGTTISNSLIRLGSATCDGSQTDCNSDDEFSSVWFSKNANITGYWKLNGTVGSIANNATIPYTVGSNGAAINTNGTGMAYAAAGKVLQGVSFDGLDDGIKVTNYTNINFNTANKYTVSFWYKPTTISGLKYIFDKQGPSFTGYYAYRSGSTVFFGFPNGTAWNEMNTGAVLVAGNWYHIVATHSGTVQSIYVNGILRSTRTPSPAITMANSSTDLYLGRSVSGGSNESMVLDEFALMNTDLTAAEVLNIYNRQATLKSGVFTSRIINSLTAGSSWTTFNWETSLPFFKAMPDAVGGVQNELNANYNSLVDSTGNLADATLMNNIVGLWHLDEVAGTTTTNSVIDKSGSGKNGTPTTGVTFGNPGRFATSAYFTAASNGITIPTPTLYTNVSFSAWVNPSDTFPSTANIVGGVGIFQYVSISGGAYQVYDGVAWRNAGVLPVGRWSHVGLTFRGSTKQLDLYVNGVKTYSASGLSTYSNGQLYTIGIYYGSAIRKMVGGIDEVAMWSRILDDSEMLQAYRRGANRVKFQVRTCTNSGCSEDPSGSNWRGPNGRSTYFSEQYNMVTQNNNPTGGVKTTKPSMQFSNFSSPAASKQYFQYRAIFESDDTSTVCSASYCSPELKAVSVDPIHYDTSAPSIITNNAVSFTKALKAMETLNPSCSGGVYYNLSLNGTTWYYWNGSTWVVSNGTTSNANTAAVLMSVNGIANFNRVVGSGTIYVKMYLKSTGTSPCGIQKFELQGQ